VVDKPKAELVLDQSVELDPKTNPVRQVRSELQLDLVISPDVSLVVPEVGLHDLPNFRGHIAVEVFLLVEHLVEL
jgi:hypothetical protein